MAVFYAVLSAFGLLLACSSAQDAAPVDAAGGQSPSGGGGVAASTGGSSVVGGSGVGAGGLAAGGGSTAGAGSAGTVGNAAGAPTGGGGGGANGGRAGAGGQAQAGGGMGNGGNGGNGGSTGYEPCPHDGSACRVLPFGDSITFGYGSTDGGGYRSPLYARIAEGGKLATFVGSQSGGPDQVLGKPFPKQHEGHSGWTIDSGYVSFGQGISTLVPKPAFDKVPHIVLLMIGTNDVGANMGTSSIHERLERLLDKIVAAAPAALVVVAKLTPIKYNPAPLAPYNAKIADVVNARVAKGQHFALVDMSAMPLADLASDSLHPNDAGYAWMAGTWYTAIEDYLPR